MSAARLIPFDGLEQMCEQARRTGRLVLARQHFGLDDPKRRVEVCVEQIRRLSGRCEPKVEMIRIWKDELVGAWIVLSIARLLALVPPSAA